MAASKLQTNLCDLPTEVVCQILVRVPLVDLIQNVKLACRKLHTLVSQALLTTTSVVDEEIEPLSAARLALIVNAQRTELAIRAIDLNHEPRSWNDDGEPLRPLTLLKVPLPRLRRMTLKGRYLSFHCCFPALIGNCLTHLKLVDCCLGGAFDASVHPIPLHLWLKDSNLKLKHVLLKNITFYGRPLNLETWKFGRIGICSQANLLFTTIKTFYIGYNANVTSANIKASVNGAMLAGHHQNQFPLEIVIKAKEGGWPDTALYKACLEIERNPRKPYEVILHLWTSCAGDIQRNFVFIEDNRQYCSFILSVSGSFSSSRTTRVRKDSISYDPKDGVSYCAIAKSASSTWSRHLVTLAAPPPSEVSRWANALQLFAPALFPLPGGGGGGGGGHDGVSAKKARKLLAETVSAVSVRHPLARLASVYFQKMVDLGLTSWGEVTRAVIRRFRARGTEGGSEVGNATEARTSYAFLGDDPKYASPNEFVSYVLLELETPDLLADQHWRPQHGECPFCLLNFTVYATVETIQEDLAYFALRANLTDRLDVSLHQNPSKSKSGNKENRDPDREFWRRVSVGKLVRAARAYRLDLEMLGYSAAEYLERLGLEVPEQIREMEDNPFLRA